MHLIALTTITLAKVPKPPDMLIWEEIFETDGGAMVQSQKGPGHGEIQARLLKAIKMDAHIHFSSYILSFSPKAMGYCGC